MGDWLQFPAVIQSLYNDIFNLSDLMKANARPYFPLRRCCSVGYDSAFLPKLNTQEILLKFIDFFREREG